MTPPSIGIGIGISRIMPIATESLDPDAAVLIAAVETAKGSPVTSTQRAAIGDFFDAAKLSGCWGLVRRFRLPIWANAAANAAANAICWKTLAVGSYTVSGITHGAGWQKGDGATGYFDYLTSFSAEGLTLSDAYIFGLSYEAPASVNSSILGAGAGAANCLFRFGVPVTNMVSRWAGTGGGEMSVTLPDATGIITFSRKSGVRRISRRSSAGRSVLASRTDAAAGYLPTSRVIGMAYNNVGSGTSVVPTSWNDGKSGAEGFGMGLTDAQDAEFTLLLKTLWETCTGLTLP